MKCVKGSWTWHKNDWNEANLSKLWEVKSNEENLAKQINADYETWSQWRKVE